MKKSYLAIFSGCLLSFSTHAQLLNADFENWSTTSVNQDSAHSWSSTNHSVRQITSMITTLGKSTTASSGSFAAEIHTTPFGFAQTPVVGILTNGKARLGFDAVSTSYISGGGTPVSSNATSLDGYYKISGNYDGLVTVLMSKYNSSTQKRDTLALNSTNLSASAKNYTAFSLPLTYSGTAVADTATIVFYASDPSMVPSINCQFSTLSIDDLTLVEQLTDGSIAGIKGLMKNDTVNTSMNIEAWIYNSGSVNLNNVDLSYTINGQAVVSETHNGIILPGDSALHTFSQNWAPDSAGSYDLCVYLDGIAQDINLLNDTSCISIFSNLGLNDKVFYKTFSLYPNPANEYVHFECSEPVEIKVFNLLGQQIRTMHFTRDADISTSDLIEGLYHFEVYSTDSQELISTEKILIRH